MNRVLLLGGTGESRWISRMLVEHGWGVVGSVTTSAAQGLFAQEVEEIFVGKFTVETLKEFVKNKRIVKIVDATHPFAVEISTIAMQISREEELPYLRYERPSLSGQFLNAPSLEWVAETLSTQPGNVLLATGAKHLQPFCRKEFQGRVFFRLLKTEFGRDAVCKAAISEEQLWWDDSNPSAQAVRDFLRLKKISFAVVKDSGPQGISARLAAICPEEGVRLYVLQRHSLDYPMVCSNPQELEAALG